MNILSISPFRIYHPISLQLDVTQPVSYSVSVPTSNIITSSQLIHSESHHTSNNSALCNKYISLCVFVIHVLCVYCCSYLDAGLLARSQYPEGPATGHLDTGFFFSLCLQANAEMVPKFPSCYYMPLM